MKAAKYRIRKEDTGNRDMFRRKIVEVKIILKRNQGRPKGCYQKKNEPENEGKNSRSEGSCVIAFHRWLEQKRKE